MLCVVLDWVPCVFCVGKLGLPVYFLWTEMGFLYILCGLKCHFIYNISSNKMLLERTIINEKLSTVISYC